MAKKERIKCYTYLRVSTKKQVEEGGGIDNQRANVQKLADLKGFEIVREYEDAGFSGADIANRPAFKQMMADIQSKKDGVSYVLAFKLSRIGRNAIDTLDSLRIMQRHGVNLITDDGQVDSSSGYGNFMILLMSGLAEMERENIKTQTFAGRVRKATEGRWNGGQAPYGYRLVPATDKASKGILEINEEEAELIRLIFERYAYHDRGFGSVAEYLITHGYSKIQRGNGKLEYIDTSFIHRVICNEVYIGKMPYGKSSSVKNETTGKVSRIKQKDYQMYDGLQEGIISQELWNAAQKKHQQNLKHQPKVSDPNHAHIFSSILVCPVCGGPMHGNGGLGKVKLDGKHGGGQYYYSCTNHRHKKGERRCPYAKGWRQDKIDSLMAKTLVNLTTSQDFQTEMMKQIGKTVDTTELENDKSRLLKVIAQKQSAKKRLANSMDNLPYDTPHYDEKYADMEERYNALYDDIDELQAEVEHIENTIISINNQTVTRDGIYRFMLDFGKVYDELSEIKKKEVANRFIERIEIFPEEQDDGSIIKSITFRFPVRFGGEYVNSVDLNSMTTLTNVETCLLLVRENINDDESISVKFETQGLELSAGNKKDAEKPTYANIKKWINDKYSLKVSTLNIAQIKDKLGLSKRDNYNRGDGKSKVPNCTKEKEQAIKDAFKHFGLI